MKWGFCVSALLIEGTRILGEIYIREELVQGALALGIRDVGTDIWHTHTHTPAYSSCILSYTGDGAKSTLKARTDAAIMSTITVNPYEPQATLTVRPDPDAEHDASEFCSGFLRHPATAVTKTVFLTSMNTITLTATAAVTRTSTIIVPGTTVSALCPIPTSNMTCGLSGWGYAANNIYAGASIDPPVCQQLCLNNPACESFQVVTNTSDPLYTPLCNLYNVTAGGNNTIVGSTSPYSFYDRDCQDFSPSGCSVARTTPAAVLQRDEVVNNEPTPTFFIGIPSDVLSNVCACVLSTTLQTAVATKTVSSVALKTTSVTATLVQTLVLTTTIGGSTTVLSSVH